MYDAVLMWAYGVNLTLEQGGSPDDGVAVTNNIINHVTFEGITGKVSIHKYVRNIVCVRDRSVKRCK